MGVGKMRWPRSILVLLAGFCSVGMAGCANLKVAGDGSSPASATRAGMSGPAAEAALFSSFGLSPTGAKASGQSSDRALESQFALARLCERRGETEQAKRGYGELMKLSPQDARVPHRLGVLAIQEANFAEAEQLLTTSRSLAPPTLELLSDMGYCYYLQNRLPEAENVLSEALKQDPNYAPAINNLALVKGREGRFQESLELFKRTNSEAEAYADLAYVYAQNGQLEKAEETYLQALTLDNRMRAAAQAMLQIGDRKEKRGNLESGGYVPASAPFAGGPIRTPSPVVASPQAANQDQQPTAPDGITDFTQAPPTGPVAGVPAAGEASPQAIVAPGGQDKRSS
jgi:Flp pilus assembly protein TadD